VTEFRYSVDELVVELREEAGRWSMHWRGTSAARVMSMDLVNFVDRLFQPEVSEQPLEVHLEGLTHANSQAVGFITGFVGRTMDREGETVFVYDPKLNYQRVLFTALEPMLQKHAQVKFSPLTQ